MSITIEQDPEVEIAQLVALPAKMTALEVFATPFEAGKTHPIETTLARVRKEIQEFQADVTTAAGRKRIASMAYRISQAKSAIEEVGAAIAKEQKEIPKRIDATRKHAKDTLDAWRGEVRAPLDAWEAAETERINRIKDSIARIQSVIDDRAEKSSESLRTIHDQMQRLSPTEDAFGEYAGAAAELRERALAHLSERIAATEKREADAAELVRLREEKAARERIEREADERAAAAEREQRIAREAAERERLRAEAAAKAEREAAEARERQLRAEVEAAERRAVEAARKAKDEAEAAIRAEQAAQAAREADKTHKAKINRAALEALTGAGIAEDVAKQVIKLIVTGKVPSVAISY